VRIEVLTDKDFTTLTNPGVQSTQILWPGNSPAAQITITRVVVEPGASQARHSHAAAEQVWIVEQGEALLLMNAGASRPIRAGDVLRTPPGETHGIANEGKAPFVYMSITTPPVDFRTAYSKLEASRQT